MADFVQKTVNKTAVRDLAVPIATIPSFNTLIGMVIADNPFGCVGYTGADGVPVAAVIRNREHYTAKVDFVDGAGKKGRDGLPAVPLDRYVQRERERGPREHRPRNRDAPVGTKFCRSKARAPQVRLAMGGVAERNFPGETYYAQLKCHDPSDVSKPFGLLLPVATPTSPSPERPSGSSPERTTPSRPPCERTGVKRGAFPSPTQFFSVPGHRSTR